MGRTDNLADTSAGATAAALAGVRLAVRQGLVDVSGARLYVGFSGGLDSTVLLHASANCLVDAAQNVELIALHANHGLHPAAADWQRRAASFCASLSVPCRSAELEVSRDGNLEAMARRARYAFFTDELGTGDTLWLAHHRDDQVETLLLHLFQGRGVYGMPMARKLGRGRLARPFLNVSRGQLAAYASHFDLHWSEDDSNLDSSFERNFLRSQVLPLVRSRWPDVDRRLVSTLASNTAVDRALLRGIDAFGALPCESLLGLGYPERAAILGAWIRSCHRHGNVSRRSLLEFARQLDAPPSADPQLDAGDLKLRRYRDRLFQVPSPPHLLVRYPIARPGRISLPHGVVVLAPAGRDQRGLGLQGETYLGFRTGGERLEVHGITRTLKQLFYEARIPPWQRSSYPLLFDSLGLAAVPGIAVRSPQQTNPEMRTDAHATHELAPGDAEPEWTVSWTPISSGPSGYSDPAR